MTTLAPVFALSALAMTMGSYFFELPRTPENAELAEICTDEPVVTNLTKQQTIDAVRDVAALAGQSPAVEEYDAGSRSYLKFAFPANNISFHIVLDREKRLNCTISAETFNRFRPG